MNDAPVLTAEEHEALLAALHEPLACGDAEKHGLYLRLCGLRLLQRAGAVSLANGWDGSPHAFILTREGWNLLKAGRSRAPVRRAG
ncbi:MAG: hypothetical protein ACREE0_02000 [Phenylobacterium sp.]